MATAKKQPSGMWKVRVYSHTSLDGKKHYKAFTAPTKQEAEQMAARFSGDADRAKRVDLTVVEAIEGYIRSREGILSPTTIRGYRAILRRYYSGIGTKRIRKITSADLQLYVSELAKTVGEKTVRNAYFLLASSIRLYAPDLRYSVKLPPKKKTRMIAPADVTVQALFDLASPSMKKAIVLAAFGSLRRGEVCALKYGDVMGNVAHVHADMVKTDAGIWVYKDHPKTSDSDRLVVLPDAVAKLIGSGEPDAYVVPICPDTITSSFRTLRMRVGIDGLKFHDLRKYFASIAAVLGIPDIYTESMGGWVHGSSVMKQIYQHMLPDQKEVYAAKMASYFDDLLKV